MGALDELEGKLAELEEQGSCCLRARSRVRRARGAVRRPRRHQPRLEQLPGVGESPARQRGGREGGPRARRRVGRGANDRRLDEQAPRARAALRGVQACGRGADVPVGVHGERGNGGGHPGQGDVIVSDQLNHARSSTGLGCLEPRSRCSRTRTRGRGSAARRDRAARSSPAADHRRRVLDGW